MRWCHASLTRSFYEDKVQFRHPVRRHMAAGGSVGSRGRGGACSPTGPRPDVPRVRMGVVQRVWQWFRVAFGPGPRSGDGRRTGGTMDIKRDRMVFLGYGKYWRSDAIIGLMPIE